MLFVTNRLRQRCFVVCIPWPCLCHSRTLHCTPRKLGKHHGTNPTYDILRLDVPMEICTSKAWNDESESLASRVDTNQWSCKFKGVYSWTKVGVTRHTGQRFTVVLDWKQNFNPHVNRPCPGGWTRPSAQQACRFHTHQSINQPLAVPRTMLTLLAVRRMVDTSFQHDKPHASALKVPLVSLSQFSMASMSWSEFVCLNQFSKHRLLLQGRVCKP